MWLKNEKRSSYDNQPYGSAYIELFALAYPKGHPYHHPTIGSMEDLDAASLQDVRSFFTTWYAPNNAVLTVVGDIDEEEIIAAVERHFGAIPANPALPAHPDLTLSAPLGGEIRKTIHDKVPEARVHFAFRAPVLSAPLLPAIEIATQILAGGKGSRLYRRLVRDEQVAQDVSLSLLPFVGGASIIVGAAGDSEVVYDVEQKIRASVVTRPLGRNGTSVRVTFQRMVWNNQGAISTNESIEEPQLYQDFFSNEFTELIHNTLVLLHTRRG